MNFFSPSKDDDVFCPTEKLAKQEKPSMSIAEAFVGIEQQHHNIETTLQNVVSTFSLGITLDLNDISLKARNIQYQPKRFASVVVRISEPKTTALIFANGKVVVTGAKSEADSKLAARKFAKIIQKLGYDNVKFKDFKIQNMIAAADVKFPIRLKALSIIHAQFSSYEPELFPGLVYRVIQPKLVILIFASGKLVVSGAKSREDITYALDQIYPVLEEFKKTSSSSSSLNEKQ